MKKSTFMTIFIMAAAFAAFAQTKDEQALLKFIGDYDQRI